MSTGLARHAATVSFASARALTSHARRIYRERYEGKYRYSQLMYAFDLFLLGVAATLVGLVLFFTFHGSFSSDGGLKLVFSAPQIRVSDSTTFSAVATVTDQRAHTDLRLTWALPSWVEVVRANPPISRDGMVHLGNIHPGQSVRSDLLVRVRTTPGTSVPVSFALSQFDLFGENRVSGIETRIAGASVLTASPASAATRAVSGASLPITVTNGGHGVIPSVSLVLSRNDGAPEALIGGGRTFQVGTLQAGESRSVSIDIGRTSATSVVLGWQLHDGAQAVGEGERSFSIVPDTATGTDILLPQIVAVTSTVPFTVAARYYSAAGDQIGVGPLPPKAGEATTYWIVWSVGPTETDIRGLHISAVLPSRVIPTGKYASSFGGTFSGSAGGASWDVPLFASTAGETATFAFEVRATPSSLDVGKPMLLVQSSRVTGMDTVTGDVLRSSAGSVTTDLTDDKKAEGKGSVVAH